MAMANSHSHSHSVSSHSPTATDRPDRVPYKDGPMDFTPEELASQMTLLDIQLFKTITPDEVVR